MCHFRFRRTLAFLSPLFILCQKNCVFRVFPLLFCNRSPPSVDLVGLLLHLKDCTVLYSPACWSDCCHAWQVAILGGWLPAGSRVWFSASPLSAPEFGLWWVFRSPGEVGSDCFSHQAVVIATLASLLNMGPLQYSSTALRNLVSYTTSNSIAVIKSLRLLPDPSVIKSLALLCRPRYVHRGHRGHSISLFIPTHPFPPYCLLRVRDQHYIIITNPTCALDISFHCSVLTVLFLSLGQPWQPHSCC